MYGYIKLDGLSQIMSLLKYNDDPFENNWETTYIHYIHTTIFHAATSHMQRRRLCETKIELVKTIGNF